ncbi:GNAT family N-acetyltransferase [Mycolicibacterium sp. XJ1819]
MDFESARLDSEYHILDGFDCGKEQLNTWLVQQAVRADQTRTAQVTVWTPLGECRVCAYFAICPTVVSRKDDGISGSLAGGVSTIPGYLIAKLALDSSLHGRGFGEQLLRDAIARVVEASNHGGGRLIVVDAIDDEAAEFYVRYGFVPVRNCERRLVMKIATAAKALRDE